MMDESFHLTPLDVRRYEFGKALRGYDPERVDQFREQVAEELERLARLNQDLDAKARGFHEQLRAFRERDKAINDALVSAQQLRNDIREQAEKEAQLIVREARADAERLIEDARAEIRRMEDQLSSLDRGRRAYLAQIRVMVERQLSEIVAAEQTPTPDVSFRDGAGRASQLPPAAAAPNAPATESTNGPAGNSGAPSWMGSLVKE